LALEQLQEKNSLDYSLLNDVVVKNLEVANAREEMLFSETGLLSMGLGLAGFGGLGGLLGLMRKRPGDWTKDEVDNALADANIETTKKESQIYELVKGVQEFINAGKGEELKSVLAKNQSADTKKTVATIKATL